MKEYLKPEVELKEMLIESIMVLGSDTMDDDDDWGDDTPGAKGGIWDYLEEEEQQ